MIWTFKTDAFGDKRHEREDGFYVAPAPDGPWWLATDPDGNAVELPGHRGWWHTAGLAMRDIDRAYPDGPPPHPLQKLLNDLDWVTEEP